MMRFEWGNSGPLSSNGGRAGGMAWVNIKGHRYYRRSKRVGGRVVTEHVGRGELANLEADYDAGARDLARLERVLARIKRDLAATEFAAFFELDDVVSDVVAALAHRQGWHRHKRQWRRKRGAEVRTADKLRKRVDQLIAERKAQPLLSPDLGGVPEADRAVLAKAATGDADALAAAEPYFEDASRLRRWGDPMHAARCWLVTQSCGDDILVARATHRYANSMRDGLGWVEADALQRVAILRVVNNWLAVGVLESKANRFDPQHASRAPIERALTQADRRLMQAVKMLATLRGLKPVEVLATLPAPAMT